jgi:hypothetical protein
MVQTKRSVISAYQHGMLPSAMTPRGELSYHAFLSLAKSQESHHSGRGSCSALIRGAHQHPQPAPARKNTAQTNWELAGVAGRRGVALHPATPATPVNSQFFWAVFFLAVGGWRCWCASRMKLHSLLIISTIMFQIVEE